MLLSNKKLTLCIVLIFVQQSFLAISTYFIALAGESLGKANFKHIIFNVSWFFAFALAAYVMSSLGTLFANQVQNDLWLKYIKNVFNDLNSQQNLSTKSNKEAVYAWLSTEAPVTLAELSNFILQSVSLYSNILLTFLVFGITIGVRITAIISLSVLISIILATYQRKRISKLSGEIQKTKLSAVLSIHQLWDSQLHGSSPMYARTSKEHHSQMKTYFNHTEKYVQTEQLIAVLPIMFSVPILVGTLFALKSDQIAELGILVAVLPRTLQLFGNVHSVSILNSKLILIKSKYDNLKAFSSRLRFRNLKEEIRLNALLIREISTGSKVDPTTLLRDLENRSLCSGRFLVTGENGVGKSTLLKLLKNQHREAILLSPDVNLIGSSLLGSTGEQVLQQLNYVINQGVHLLLLDEWDAHLDLFNQKRINQRIDEISKDCLVIEVRHHHQ